MAKRKNKKRKKILIFSLLLLLLISLLLLFSNTIINKYSVSPKSILSAIYDNALPLQNSNTILQKDPNSSVWWISSNNYNILIKPSDAVIFKTKSDPNKPGDGKPSFVLTFPEMKSFLNITINEFEKNGFTKNQENSSSSLSDNKFYDYVLAYEKELTKCTITVNPDSSGEIGSNTFYYNITVACTNNYQNAYDKQEPILKSLGIHDAVIYNTQKHVGNYYMFNINYRRSGYYMIAKKDGDKYKEIFSGQDMPPCRVMQENQVPKSIYDSCYDEETNSVID